MNESKKNNHLRKTAPIFARTHSKGQKFQKNKATADAAKATRELWIEFELLPWDTVRLRASNARDKKTTCPVPSTPQANLAAMDCLRQRGYLLETDLAHPFPPPREETSGSRIDSSSGPLLTFDGYRNLLTRSGSTVSPPLSSSSPRPASQAQQLQDQTPTTKIPDVELHFLPLPSWLLNVRQTVLDRRRPCLPGQSPPSPDPGRDRNCCSVTENVVQKAFPQLYPYQRKGVLQFFERGQRMLLADPMGLGKTAQACACVLLSRKAQNVLIVCPASVRNNWEIELGIWETHFAASGHTVPHGRRDNKSQEGEKGEDGDDSKAATAVAVERVAAAAAAAEREDNDKEEQESEAKLDSTSGTQSAKRHKGSKKSCSTLGQNQNQKGRNKKAVPAPLSSFQILKTGKSPLVSRAIVSYSILPSVLQQLENRKKALKGSRQKQLGQKEKKRKRETEEEENDALPTFDRYDLIVVDEAHFVKNVKSQRTKAFLKLLKFCEQERDDPVGLLLLSGTPVSRPCEMFVPFRTLLPFQDKNKGHRSLGTQMFPWAGQGQPKFYPGTLGKSLPESFGYRYCLPKAEYIGRGQVQISLAGYDRQQEFEALVGLIALRREKKEVLDLPPKIRNTIYLDGATAKEIRHFKEVLDSLSSLAEDKGKRAVEIKLMQLVSETMRIKMKILPSWLRDTLFPLLLQDQDRPCQPQSLPNQEKEEEEEEEEGEAKEEEGEEEGEEEEGTKEEQEKYLLFAHHHEVLDFLAAKLEEAGIGFVAIDGRTPPKDRQALVQDFRDKRDVVVAVLGIQSAGTGLNFQTATQVIFVELTWSEKDTLQAEDRAHRIGVKGTVFIHYLCLQGSTDDFMLRAIKKKTRTAQRILQETNGPLLTE
jgi:SNF2 family DNA or RNA helicase